MRFTACASASVLSTGAPPGPALPRCRANAGYGTTPAATLTMVMASRRRRRRVNSVRWSTRSFEPGTSAIIDTLRERGRPPHDSDQDWHLTPVEAQKSERSLVDLSGSAITGSGTVSYTHLRAHETPE